MLAEFATIDSLDVTDLSGSWPLLILFAGIAVGVSFLCSLFEAVLLSVRSAALSERKSAGSRGAGLLQDIKQSRLDDAIAAILTLNTIAHTFGAFMAGAQALALGLPEGLVLGILTLLILVLSEIIPKTVGASYAVSLSGFVGRGLQLLLWVMRPVLGVTRGLTRFLVRGKKHLVSREELGAFIEMATREGALEGHEQRVMSNILGYQKIQVADVMTPRTVVEMLPGSTTIVEFLENQRVRAFSRIPLYEENFDDVQGYLLVRELLQDVAMDVDRQQPISKYMRKIWFLPELASIHSALRQFLERREHIAVALDEHGGVSGLVTFEDIIETILGVEIVDEADRVADLRRVAAGIRDRRLERMRADGQLRDEA